MVKCGKCERGVQEEIECFGCDREFHFKCTKLTEGSWKSMGAARKEKWRCYSCRNSDTIIPETQESETDLKKIDEILRIVKNQESEITTIMAKLDNLSEELTFLKKEVKRKDEKIVALEKQLREVVLKN